MIGGVYYYDKQLEWFQNHAGRCGPAYDYLPRCILDEVNRVNDNVYFYGSRSMMYIPQTNTESDWDFAISRKVDSKHLIDLGYERKERDYIYEDGMSFEVWEKTINDGGVDYQIQLVSKHNTSIFTRVWESISPEYWATYINKRSPSYIGKQAVHDFINQLRRVHESYYQPLDAML